MSLSDIMVGGGLGLVAVLSLIQITPIKIDPWSALMKWISHSINGEMQKEVGVLNTTIANHIKKDDERYAKQCRLRILRFNDELLQREPRHTKEHFDEILDDITEYEKYCRDHPDYKNNKAVMAIDNVRRVYRDCLAKNNFL